MGNSQAELFGTTTKGFSMNPRMPTQYSLHRASTGRLASGFDNTDFDKLKGKTQQVQNVPRRLRDAVVADPGHVLLGADWAGIEWALVMYFAAKIDNPPGFHLNLLEKFQRGEFDPHCFLASIAYNTDYDELVRRHESGEYIKERKLCKPYTHGRNYYGAPRTLAREAGHKDSVGVLVCKAHSRAFRPEPWWEYELDSVKKLKYVQTPLGWRRYFWDYEPKPTEVFGTKIQATAADLMKYVMLNVFETLPVGFEALTTTHDNLLLQVDEPHAEDGAAWLKRKMEQRIPWLDNRRWRADVKVGKTWRDVS